MAADDSSAPPTDYRDPYWTALADTTGQKLGLPVGLLPSIVTRGERSNADQVNSAGARTPFQITPSTRNLALQKYGIDGYLSPQNAAEVSGLLLKDSLDRNNGDIKSAVGEYVGGTNRDNWGPVTKAYIGRVMLGQQSAKANALDNGFSQWMADHPASPPPAAAPAPAAPTDQLSADFGNWMKRTGGGQRDPADMIPVNPGDENAPYVPPPAAAPAPQPGLMDKIVGAGEAGLQAATGAIGGTLGQLGGGALGLVEDVHDLAHGDVTPHNLSDLAQAGQQALTYQPRTPLGQQYGDAVQSAAQNLAPLPGLTGEMGAMGALAGPASAQIGAAVRAAPAAILDAARTAKNAIRPSEPVALAADAAQAAPADATVANLAQTAKQAAGGSTDARQVLADQAAPDPSIVKSAERLGVQDYLQPDHVTTNDAYRQVVGAIKSNPQSEVALSEAANLPKVAQRASDLIDDIGGTNDLSALDSSIKDRMQATHTELSNTEDGLYDQLRAQMPAKTEAPATNVLDFVKQRADELGGPQNLSPLEKSILSKLSPKPAAEGAAPAEAAMSAAQANDLKAQIIEAKNAVTRAQKAGDVDAIADNTAALTSASQKLQAGTGETFANGQFVKSEPPVAAPTTPGLRQPTYALLDDVRKDIGAAARMKGAFADSDTGLAKALYGKISQDQEAAVSGAGLSDTFKAAKQATIVRKGLEDDLASLFGKNLDRSVVAGGTNGLPGAIRGLASGDTSGLARLMSAVPADMRQAVAASGLGTVFRKSATRGEMDFTGYAKWMDGLMRNRQAYAALMSNLPLGARKQLMALYKVSKGISDSMQTRIKTGALNTIKEEMMRGTDGLMSSLYNAAGSSAGKFAAHTVLGHIPVVGHGLAAALTSAISHGKTKPLAAVDALLASPEFAALAKSPAGPARAAAVRQVAVSPIFGNLMRKVGTPMTISERERWIVQAMQNTPNTDQNQRRPALALVR